MSNLKQSSEYLANGFATVDSSKNQIIYMNCLNYIDSLPYFNSNHSPLSEP